MDSLSSITSLDWENLDAAFTFVDVVAKYGAPSVFVSDRGGHASWDRSSFGAEPFFKIDVMDRESFPVAVYVHYDMTSKRCNADAFLASDRIGFDGTEKLLWARGNSMEECVAVLMVVTSVGNCVVSYILVKEQDVLNKAKSAAGEKADLFIRQLDTNLMEQPLCIGRSCVK